MSLSRAFDYTFVIASIFEVPVYVATDNAIIESFGFAVQVNGLKDAVNNSTISAINKGNDGTGNEIIFSMTNDDNNPDAIDFLALIPILVEGLNHTVTKGDVVILKKTENGAGNNLGLSSIIVTERRF